MSRLDTMLELARKLCTVRLSVPVRLLKEAEGRDTPMGGAVTRVSLTLVRGEVVVSVSVTATMGTAASELSNSHSGYLGSEMMIYDASMHHHGLTCRSPAVRTH